jgi:hypothetical protein
MTVRQRAEAEQLVQAAAQLQRAFWEVLLELEQVLGVRIDETRDLSDWNVDEVFECAEDDVGPISWLDASEGGQQMAD